MKSGKPIMYFLLFMITKPNPIRNAEIKLKDPPTQAMKYKKFLVRLFILNN